MSTPIRDQTIEQIDRLDDPRQQQVLEFARRLSSPVGTRGRDVLRFVGAIDLADLEVMSQAIQEGCEKVSCNG